MALRHIRTMWSAQQCRATETIITQRITATQMQCTRYTHSSPSSSASSSHSSSRHASHPPPPSPPSPINYDLSGRTALITGASGGIGLAISKLLYEQGVRIALCSRDIDKAKQAIITMKKTTEATHAAELKSSSSTTSPSSHPLFDPLPYSCDVSDSSSVDRFVDAAHTALGGRIDLVIHAAGINQDSLIVRAKDESELTQHNTCNTHTAHQAKHVA